jgi:hypothetical protein
LRSFTEDAAVGSRLCRPLRRQSLGGFDWGDQEDRTMKDRLFWFFFALVLFGMFFLLPEPFVDSVTRIFTG